MENLKQAAAAADVKSAQKVCKSTIFIKVVLAIFVALAYFFEWAFLMDLIVFSVILSLILPLGFYGVFIENLLEYNTQVLEDRQTLNATEANEHFAKFKTRIDNLEYKVKKKC